MSKVEPQEYRKILENIELKSIACIKMNSNLTLEHLESQMKIAIKDDAKFDNTENGFNVEIKYTLTSKNKKKRLR